MWLWLIVICLLLNTSAVLLGVCPSVCRAPLARGSVEAHAHVWHVGVVSGGSAGGGWRRWKRQLHWWKLKLRDFLLWIKEKLLLLENNNKISTQVYESHLKKKFSSIPKIYLDKTCLTPHQKCDVSINHWADDFQTPIYYSLKPFR